MQMLYHSDQYVVVQFEVPAEPGHAEGATRGAYEIVDKSARRECFLDGALAEKFRQDVQALVQTDPSPEQIDDYLAGYMALAQHPVTLH